MLLYEYPPKRDKRTEQLIEFNAETERKKIRKKAIKNALIALIIFVLSFFVENVTVKIFVIALSAFSFISAYLVYLSAKQLNDKRSKTKIFDDRIEHSQTAVFTNKITEYVVYFDDVESSSQNVIGEMIFKLKDGHKTTVRVKIKGNETLGVVKDNCVSMFFVNSKPKYYLINNLYERINYPKKNYIEYNDDDEDDDWNTI